MEVMLGVSVYAAVVLLIFLLAYVALRYTQLPAYKALGLYPAPPQEESAESRGAGGARQNKYKDGRLSRMLVPVKRLWLESLRGFSAKYLFDTKRPFWWLSCSLRLGFLLLAFWTLLLVAGALLSLAGVEVDGHAFFVAAFFYYFPIPLGVAGFLLATFGMCAQILRRLNDTSLRGCVSVQDFFDSFLLLTTLVTGLLLWGSDLTFAGARDVAAQVLSFSRDLQTSPLLVMHLVLLDVMLIYVPVSRLVSHGYGDKYSEGKAC